MQNANPSIYSHTVGGDDFWGPGHSADHNSDSHPNHDQEQDTQYQNPSDNISIFSTSFDNRTTYFQQNPDLVCLPLSLKLYVILMMCRCMLIKPVIRLMCLSKLREIASSLMASMRRRCSVLCCQRSLGCTRGRISALYRSLLPSISL